MCGRFENKIREDWMMDKFAEFDVSIKFKTSTDKRKLENIAPTNSIVIILNDNNELFADIDKWGIKFSAKSPLMFNSRIETISTKRFWRKLFNRNRCLVPMTAFYEWKIIESKKVPHRISLKNEEIFFVPGLYHTNKKGIKFISLITTEPNDFMKEIHHRMPVILNIKDAIAYMNDDADNNFEKCLPFKDSDNMKIELAELN